MRYFCTNLVGSYLDGAYLCADASSLAQASILVASNNEGKSKVDVIQDVQISQDPLMPDDQTSPDPVIQDSTDLAVPDQSSSVSGNQASLDVVALDNKVLDNPGPVIDDCTSSVDVTSNVHELQDGIKTHVVQLVQEVSDLKKKSKLISAFIIFTVVPILQMLYVISYS